MRTLIFAIFMLAFCVSSFAAPKKQANKKPKLSVNNIVNVCGEPSAGYNMQGVLGFADFMLFTHDKCPKVFGAAAVVYRGDAVKPAIKIAEAIVGLYIMTTCHSWNPPPILEGGGIAKNQFSKKGGDKAVSKKFVHFLGTFLSFDLS